MKQPFGQNFLHDADIVQLIIKAIAAQKNDHLVEIGAGKGILTKEFKDLAWRLDAIELDRDFIPILEQLCLNGNNCFIHQADALHFDFKKLFHGRKMRLLGNLPYNISTPLLFHLMIFNEYIKDMHFMLQQEVAARLAAPPNSKTYGRLSVMAQYHCRIELLFIVPPECFKPQPKVQSAFIRITPREEYENIAKDQKIFSEVVRQAFGQRRKTIRNSLKNLFAENPPKSGKPKCEEYIEYNLGISLQARAEQLTVKDFVDISNVIAGFSEQHMARPDGFEPPTP